MTREKKVSGSRAGILISLALIAIAVCFVTAYGVYSGTLDISFTGAFLSDGTLDVTPDDATGSIYAVSTIEVWAKTYIDIEHSGDTVIARLYLDDGTPIAGQILKLYADGELLASEVTDSDGDVIVSFEADNTTHDISASFGGIPEEYIHPSSSSIMTEPVLAQEANVTANETYEWISYNSETDTITIIGDGTHCTSYNPCTFTDVYEHDRANGWGRVENYNNYFIVQSAIKVGNGINKTFVISERQQFLFEKPLEILPFGSFDFMTCWIQANVSVEDLLKKESAFYVHPGGFLGLVKTSYKVLQPFSSNNILALDGSNISIERFTMQCVEDSCRTTFFLPSETRMADFNFAKNSDYRCTNPGSCLTDLMQKSYDKPMYSLGGVF